jgi:hypothetical protein
MSLLPFTFSSTLALAMATFAFAFGPLSTLSLVLCLCSLPGAPVGKKLEGGIGTLFHLNLFDDVQGPVNRLFDLLEAQPRGFPWA